MKTEQIRRFRLAVHHLVGTLPPTRLLEAAGVCGMQDTPPGSARLALAVRVVRLRPEDIDDALELERSLVNVWSRRGSPHVVPVRDVPVFTRGLEPDDNEGWETAFYGWAEHLERTGLTATEVADLVTKGVLDALSGRTLTKRELGEALANELPPELAAWFDAETFASFSVVIARAVSRRSIFCLAPRHGREASFVRLDEWLDEVPRMSRREARAELVRRYLHAYGPSTPETFAEWAGVSVPQARRSWELVADELAPVVPTAQVRGHVLAADLDLLAAPPEPRGARLLPPHDPYLAGLDRSVIIEDPARRKLVWRSSGNPGVVLVGGEVEGVWRPRKRGRHLDLTLTMFRRPDLGRLASVGYQAERIATQRGCDDVDIHIED